ncbi:MAG: ATP-binding protein [Elusimicrobia bacterium]|nr:ATP-binding protein [Elusimicrobiota bacterium]
MYTKYVFDRWYSSVLAQKLRRPYVHLVFGARQTGKSTLLRVLLPPDARRVNLADPEERSRYLAHPGDFITECRALAPQKKPWFVFVDEAQNAPVIFDAVQSLYDEDKTRWRFILCGSSARRLRRSGSNLLPGRSMLHRLYPLTLLEHPAPDKKANCASPLPLSWPKAAADPKPFPSDNLYHRLAYGELPAIAAMPNLEDRSALLKSYAVVYLEEEIRREATIKDWGAFVRFLQLAAAESGQILNYAGISQETGISQPTVKSYYQLLEDMFVGFQISAYTKSPRKNILSTPKFFIFDVGVRHAAAGLVPSPDIIKANPGPIFEQWVGIELWKRLQYLGEGRLYYQRTKDGAEIDFVVEINGRLIPIEVKWTQHPAIKDAKHLLVFLNENPKTANHGYMICRNAQPMRLHEKITALPWACL